MTLANRFSKINIHGYWKSSKHRFRMCLLAYFSFHLVGGTGGRFRRNSIPHLEIGKNKQTIIIYFLLLTEGAVALVTP
jgi:hypothetical protein